MRKTLVVGGWQGFLMVLHSIGAVVASAVAAIGLFIAPGDASIPVHAGFSGFDAFAPRNRGLITLALLPLLVAGAMFLSYWSRQDSPVARNILAVTSFLVMVIMVVFNIQAIRYAMRA